MAPVGIPLLEPAFGPQMLYCTIEAWMIKALRSIVDTVGHYARPDVFKLLIRQDEWREAGSRGKRIPQALADKLKRSAEAHDVDEAVVLKTAQRMAGVEAAE
jgi:hypothetical protein